MTAQVHITLHPDGVAAPALSAIQNTIQVVAFCLDAIEKGDLEAPPSLSDIGMRISFSSDPRSTDQRRQVYRNWVLTKALAELARGIRQTLEEAYFYVEVAKLQGTVITHEALQQRFATIREEANKANFPSLIEHVNEALEEKLDFEKEFRSLNRVRNCLEHRNGVVGLGDVDSSTGTLVLTLPCLKCFYDVEGQEAELRFGEVFEKGAELTVRRATDQWIYRLGDRVVITSAGLQTLGLACWFFVQDLASKLPRLSAARTAA